MVSLKAVSKLLYDLWDPIDIKALVTSTDEYDDWAPPIVELLNSGSGVNEVSNALDGLLIGMRLKPDQDRSRLAAEALIRLREAASRKT